MILKFLKRWSIIIPLLTMLATGIGFVLGKAYQAGCESEKRRQRDAATSELFIDVKDLKAAVNEVSKQQEFTNIKVRNIEKSIGRLERTIERFLIGRPVALGKSGGAPE